MRTTRTPFARAMAMMAAVASIMSEHAHNFAFQKAAIAKLGPYESRGKGKTRRHDNGGTKAHQRAATKHRNVLRNRRAHRG